MSELQAFLGDRAIPELFDRLYGDAERLSGDIERLKRFVDLTMAESSSATASNPVAKKHSLESWLQKGFISREEASAFGDRSISPDPQPSTPVPVEMESIARQRLEDDADAAAKEMVTSFDLMKRQKQTTGTSLACALRVMREASAGFECSQTMQAIIKALDEIGTATREATSHG